MPAVVGSASDRRDTETLPLTHITTTPHSHTISTEKITNSSRMQQGRHFFVHYKPDDYSLKRYKL